MFFVLMMKLVVRCSGWWMDGLCVVSVSLSSKWVCAWIPSVWESGDMFIHVNLWKSLPTKPQEMKEKYPGI